MAWPKGRKHSQETVVRMRQAARLDRRVPAWVPADLKSEFRDAMELFGEEAAASLIRRMKREAAEGASS